MPIDKRLAGHILLDPELQGRYDVQGNWFQTTFAYLKQFIDQFFHESEDNQVKQLMQLMQSLIEFEQYIRVANGNSINREEILENYIVPNLISTENLAEELNEETLKNRRNRLTNALLTRIQDLELNQTVFIPGGWSNLKSGHAMIYQFKRTEQGIQFSIYNSGSGLAYHQKISTVDGERYYPVRSHLISKLEEKPQELEILIERLLNPQIPNITREHEYYDAKLLYQDIDKSLTFLEATPIEEAIPEELTTKGQSSGTCSQRVIHQMLKLCLGNLAAYEAFSLEFKMHTLKDFAETASPDDAAAVELIRLSVKKIAKMIKKIHPENEVEYTNELKEIKARFSPKNASKVRSKNPDQQVATPPPSIRLIPNFLNNNEEIAANFTYNTYQELTSLDFSQDLFPQLTALLAHCEALQSTHADFVIEQLELAIASLPLPPSFDPTQQNAFSVYASIIQNPDHISQMQAYLERLQKLYTQIYKARHSIVTKTPRQQVVHGILIGLYDYFYLQSQPAHLKNAGYAAKHVHSGYLSSVWCSHDHSPFMGTNHPLFDQQFERLLALYKPYSKNAQDFSAEKRSLEIATYYKSLFTTEELRLLERIYDSLIEATIDQDLINYLNRNGLCTVYVAFLMLNNDLEFNLKQWELYSKGFSQDLKSSIQQNGFPKFVQQVRLEKFIADGVDILTEKHKPSFEVPSFKRKIGESGRAGAYSFQHVLSALPDLHPNQKFTALACDPIAVLALDAPQHAPESGGKYLIDISSNRIQTAIGDSSPKDVLFIHDLLHLRTSPQHQIQLTLDYFKKEIHRFSDLSVQQYIEGNVFERDLLDQLLDNKPIVFLQQFEDFIRHGLQHFLDEQALYSVPSLGFVHLRFLMHDYWSYKNPEDAYQRLQQDLEELSNLINLPHDESIKASLHQYRFLTALRLYQLNPETQTQYLSEALISLLAIQAIGDPFGRLGIDTQIQIEHSKHHTQGWLEKVPEEVRQPIIQSSLENHLKLDSKHYSLEGRYPQYQLTSSGTKYEIDAAKGCIYLNGKAQCKIPYDIQGHPFLEKLSLGNEASCFCSQDGKAIEFATAKQQVRVKKSYPKTGPNIYNPNWEFEKKWSFGTEESTWYRFCPIDEQQNEKFKLGEFNTLLQHSLPKILQEDQDLQVWVKLSDNTIVLAKHDQVIYQSDAEGRLYALDAQGDKTGFVLSNYDGPFSEQLAEFEDPSYCIILKNCQESQQEQFEFYRYTLPRYQLDFEIRAGKVMLYGSDFFLSNEPSPFSAKIRCLTATNEVPNNAVSFVAASTVEDLDAKQGEKICIIAIQPCVVDDEIHPTQGDYYSLKHDLREKTDNHWQYGLDKSYMTYKLIDGKPSPDKPADALYLCYLYLCDHQLEEAWSILEKIDGLDCTYQELIFLQWIVRKLPKAKNENETIHNPRYLACQLKALSLLTDQLAEDKQPHFPEEVSTTEETKTDVKDEIKEFYATLPGMIRSLMEDFQKTEHNLSSPYMLNSRERDSLLNTALRFRLNHEDAIKIDAIEPIGALAYQLLRLSLEDVLKEKRALEVQQNYLVLQGKNLPAKQQRRLSIINQRLKEESDILKIRTKLEQFELDFQEVRKSDNQKRLTFSAPGSLNQVLEILNSKLSVATFAENLPHYLHIALNSNDQQACQKIKFFCIRHLRVNHNPVSEEDKLHRELVYALYLLLHADGIRKEKIRANQPKPRETWRSYTLQQLFNDLATINPEPIFILQAQDVFKDLLISKEQVITDLEKTRKDGQALVLTAVDESKIVRFEAFRARLRSTILNFSEFENEYKEREKAYQDQLQDVLEQLKSQQAGELAQMQHEYQLELQAAQLKYQLEFEHKRAAKEHLENNLDYIKQLAEISYEDLIEAEELAWHDALKLAHTILHAQTTEQVLEQIAGLKRETITRQDLIKLYFNADAVVYQETTGLSVEKVQELHQLIHVAVTQSIETAHLKRLVNDLNEEGVDRKQVSAFAENILCDVQAEIKDSPAHMVFQYEENIILHQRQCLALKNLLTPDPKKTEEAKLVESVEKVKMGGGKSKVILPTIAQQLANGQRLVFIEVPRALLTTNFWDLRQLSRRLFGQKARCFEFRRDSNCSPKRLQEIHDLFVKSMLQKDYWVTTGDSIQSLELKYLELLLAGRPEKDAEIWEQQVYWLGKITNLVRDFGHAVIDEVHQGLQLKKELNYSIGGAKPIDPVIRKHSIALFRFIQSLSRDYQPKSEYANNLAAIEEEASETTPLRADAMREAWAFSLSRLVDELLERAESPLREVIAAIQVQVPSTSASAATSTQRVINLLKDYLLNKEDWAFIATLDPVTQDTLAFYKEQLSTLLPHTLAQKHKVTYGPSSEKRNPDPIRQVVAVPYIANSQPSERSDFGSALTKINYTIQSLLIDGLNDALLREIVIEWLGKARLQLKEDPSLQLIQNTDIAIAVNRFLAGTGFTLQTLNVKNEQQMQQLLEKVRFNDELILQALESNVLERITIEPHLLRSNAINHVDLYQHVEGLSGTPYNFRTYHRLQFNQNTALGTDDYLGQLLIEKQTPIHTVEFKNTKQFLLNVFNQITGNKPRALIDAGASFKGIKNREVAEELVDIWQKKDKKIKFILFFNQDNVLCAINTQNRQITELLTSDPKVINKKLACTPAQRFTYYDHAHTEGVDLKQENEATGIVTVDPDDPDMTYYRFLQSATRMRGLEDNQGIEIVNSQSRDTYTLANLFEKMKKNEQEQVCEDNFNAAIAKMANVIRNDAIQRINALDETEYDEKARYARAFEHYFLQKQQARLYEVHGKVIRAEETRGILADYAQQLETDWTECLSKLNHTPEDEASTQITHNMQKIIDESCPFCKDKVLSRSLLLDQETETQVQKETQLFMEKQNELENQVQITKQEAHEYRIWEKNDIQNCLQHQNGDTSIMQTLNQYWPSEDKAFFSANLFVSENYRMTYQNQKPDQLLDAYVKPVHIILFTQHENVIRAHLISNEEAKQLEPFLRGEFKDQAIWMETSQHTLLSGSRPADILAHPDYQTLIEQIRYFNGELGLLAQQKEPFIWLRENRQEKLDAYKKELTPFRLASSSDFALLEAKLSKIRMAISHLRENRFDMQLLAIDWEALFPNALDDDFEILHHLSQAFDEINRNVLHPNVDLDQEALIQKYSIRIEYQAELAKHFTTQQERKRFCHRLNLSDYFQNMQQEHIEDGLILMRVLNDEPIDLLPSAQAMNVFFNHIRGLGTSEWTHLIRSNYFKQIKQNLARNVFDALLQTSLDNIEEESWAQFISQMNAEERIYYIQQAWVSPEKKSKFFEPVDTEIAAEKENHVQSDGVTDTATADTDDTTRTSNTSITEINAIPEEQFVDTISCIVMKRIWNEQETRVLLAKVDHHPAEEVEELKEQILFKLLPNLLDTLVENIRSGKERYTSGAQSLKLKALEKISNRMRNLEALPEGFDLAYLFKTIQGICEHKRHYSNIFWKPHSVVEYQKWLTDLQIANYFKPKENPLYWNQIKTLADADDPIDTILSWKPRDTRPNAGE